MVCLKIGQWPLYYTIDSDRVWISITTGFIWPKNDYFAIAGNGIGIPKIVMVDYPGFSQAWNIFRRNSICALRVVQNFVFCSCM